MKGSVNSFLKEKYTQAPVTGQKWAPEGSAPSAGGRGGLWQGRRERRRRGTPPAAAPHGAVTLPAPRSCDSGHLSDRRDAQHCRRPDHGAELSSPTSLSTVEPSGSLVAARGRGLQKGPSRPIYLGADRVITDGSEISARGEGREALGWAGLRDCAEATAGPPGRSEVWFTPS